MQHAGWVISCDDVIQEKPQIVGLRPPMCWTHFFTVKQIAYPLNSCVHLQLVWLHSAYQFKVLLHLLLFGRNLKENGDIPMFAVGEVPIESPPATSKYLSIQSFARFAAVCPEFKCQIILPHATPRLVENRSFRNVDPTFSHNTQLGRQTTDRQNDRNKNCSWYALKGHRFGKL